MKSIWIPSFWGGIFIFVISVVPGLNAINCLCGAGIAGGGVLAVYLHRRAIGEEERISNSTAILMGFMSGLLGTVLSFGALWLGLRLFNEYSWSFSIDDYANELNDVLEMIDPAALPQFAFAALFLSSIAFSTLLAGVGAVIGVSLFGAAKPKQVDEPAKNSPRKDNDGIVVERDSHYS